MRRGTRSSSVSIYTRTATQHARCSPLLMVLLLSSSSSLSQCQCRSFGGSLHASPAADMLPSSKGTLHFTITALALGVAPQNRPQHHHQCSQSPLAAPHDPTPMVFSNTITPNDLTDPHHHFPPATASDAPAAALVHALTRHAILPTISPSSAPSASTAPRRPRPHHTTSWPAHAYHPTSLCTA